MAYTARNDVFSVWLVLKYNFEVEILNCGGYQSTHNIAYKIVLSYSYDIISLCE
jgi:hypothetical protein